MTGILAGTEPTESVDKMWEVANAMEGKTICALSEAAAWPCKSYVKNFGDEIKAYIEKGDRA
jgi:NADH-quinone oxidoreductase subunit F